MKGRGKLDEIWQKRRHGEQTVRSIYRLISELATWLDKKHGEVDFYLAQTLSGHGCFSQYLKSFKRDTIRLRQVGRGKGGRWSGVGAELTPDTIVFLLLQSKAV